jgi:hypothetical protein
VIGMTLTMKTQRTRRATRAGRGDRGSDATTASWLSDAGLLADGDSWTTRRAGLGIAHGAVTCGRGSRLKRLNC